MSDWSSDVCSSDLPPSFLAFEECTRRQQSSAAEQGIDVRDGLDHMGHGFRACCHAARRIYDQTRIGRLPELPEGLEIACPSIAGTVIVAGIPAGEGDFLVAEPADRKSTRLNSSH